MISIEYVAPRWPNFPIGAKTLTSSEFRSETDWRRSVASHQHRAQQGELIFSYKAHRILLLYLVAHIRTYLVESLNVDMGKGLLSPRPSDLMGH